SEHADYKTDDLRITNSRYKVQDFKAGIGYQKNYFKTDFRYNLNASQIGLPEDIGIQSTNTDPLLPSQSINNHIFSSKSSIFLKNSSFDFNLGFSYNDRKEFEDEGDHHRSSEDEAALHMKLKTFNYDLKYNLPDLGIIETIVGVQGMFQTNSNFGEEELIPDASTSDIGVLATSHIHFEKVDVQLGLRFDSRSIEVDNTFDRNYNSFNAALGARTNISEDLVARLNIASGFRAPNLAELASDGIHEGTNRYEIGNPNLDNEQNIQTDLSLEYKSEHFEFFVNGFYNLINDYIFVEPNGEFIEDDPVYNYLQDDAKLFGGEFGFHFHPHPLDWLHIESSFEAVRGERDGEIYLPLIPANKLNNIIRVEFNNEWLSEGFGFIKLKTSFEQSKVSEFETSTPSYSLLSAGFGGTIQLFGNAATLRISANNITDKVYIDHLSRLKSDGIPNMGRNFSFGIKYKI
ncbi:MAG: TonB-dependent receptor, partial [Bacteroidia bacterium]|nr:TonB-dependent receptor [Bacteroidia bacterium]